MDSEWHVACQSRISIYQFQNYTLHNIEHAMTVDYDIMFVYNVGVVRTMPISFAHIQKIYKMR